MKVQRVKAYHENSSIAGPVNAPQLCVGLCLATVQSYTVHVLAEACFKFFFYFSTKHVFMFFILRCFNAFSGHLYVKNHTIIR